MNFLSAFIVCLNSSANLTCSWSCQVSPSAVNRAWSVAIRASTSRLNRCNSSANRRTRSGSMMACDIDLLDRVDAFSTPATSCSSRAARSNPKARVSRIFVRESASKPAAVKIPATLRMSKVRANHPGRPSSPVVIPSPWPPWSHSGVNGLARPGRAPIMRRCWILN
jgi:hypothetical protein